MRSRRFPAPAPAISFTWRRPWNRRRNELGLGKHARLLVRQTLLGAAHLLESSGSSPGDLRRKVTSPGGTTHAAVSHLESRAVGQAMVEAIQAAARRSRELG